MAFKKRQIFKKKFKKKQEQWLEGVKCGGGINRQSTDKILGQ